MSAVTHATNDLPQEAYAATLAGLGPLGPARLGRLLGHWSPSEAWAAVKAGRATAVWGRGEAPATVRKAEQALARALAAADPARSWARCQAASVAVLLHGSTDYPAVLADDLVAPTRAVRPGRSSPPSTAGASPSWARAAPRRPGGRWPPSSGPGWPRPASGSCRGLARGIDGWAHRGALSAVGRRSARRRGGQRARRGVPARAPPALGRGRRAGRAAQRGAPRHHAPCPALPVAQPHPRGAGRGARRGRVQVQGRLAHHRRGGPPPGAEGVRGARVSTQRGGRGDQRPADRRCRSGRALGRPAHGARVRATGGPADTRGGGLSRGAGRPLDAPAPRHRAPASRHPGPALRSIARRRSRRRWAASPTPGPSASSAGGSSAARRSVGRHR